MTIHPLYATQCASLEELLQSPDSVVAQAGEEPLVVLSENQPLFYLLAPQAWQQVVMRLPALLKAVVPAPAPAPTMLSDCFGHLSALLLEAERQRVLRGDLCRASLSICRNRLHAHVLPWFGRVRPSLVTADTLDGFVGRLGQAGLSATTIAQYLVLVRKLLKLAVRQGLLREIPEMPRVRVVNRPRAMFTTREYRLLVRTARRLHASGQQAPKTKSSGGTRGRFWVAQKQLAMPPDMHWAIAFMVNSFVRPTDLRQLRHKHVQVVQGRHVYLRLTLPESKRHDRPVVTLRPAVRIYEAALARNRAQGRGGTEDYVFLPDLANRSYALAVLGFWFKWVLREAGLAPADHLGRQRTIYSLRHTAIMFRLLYGQGIDTLTLARNARTSVQMIERFYASTLNGEMNVGMLQSRRAAVKT